MNRRRFAGATLGAGTLLLAGLAGSPIAAFAKTKPDDDRTATDDAGDGLFGHVTSSLRRIYDRESPMAFVVGIGVEMDKKRFAGDMYDNLLTTGITAFEAEGIVFDDDREYDGDRTDQSHLYLGVIDLGDDALPVNVAVLYTRLGKRAYAIAAGDLDDATALIDEYYETLFDEDREETELLLTEDEMPRGFAISEETEDFVTEELVEDAPADDDDKKKKKERRGSGTPGRASARLARGLTAAGHPGGPALDRGERRDR